MQTAMISITSGDLNYLIFRYLHESGNGFIHSAFALGYEAGINKSNIDVNLVPPGALVTFIQKGIQYLELEANLNEDDLDTDDDFQFLHPLDLITKDVHELQKIIKEKKQSIQKDKAKGKEKENFENARERHNGLAHEKVKERPREKEKEKERGREKMAKEKEKSKEKEKERPIEAASVANLTGNEINVKLGENGIDGGAEPMDICPSSAPMPVEIPNSDLIVLQGHTSEVFACAWNPSGSLLASGSGDSTARIWTTSSSSMQNGPSCVVLKHVTSRANDQSKDVTTLDWNVDGSLLATGCYDGQARIWSKDGELVSTLNKHKGPIFSLKWNKKGDYLLTGSVDTTTIVWDTKTGECKQQYEFHRAPTLDVDWRNNLTFATCSTDRMIYICKVGEKQPIKAFKGHQGEVNAIKWDPTGSILASCSDDYTAKIWSLKQDTCILDLKEHTKEIYTCRWSPTGPGSNNPSKKLVLATASFDSTIKLLDVEAERVLQTFSGHRDPVYSVAFSPNGEYLASGSLDKSMNVWSLKEGKIVKTFRGNGGIFEVCWNKEGDRIAACFADNVVCVLDIRM